MLRTPIAAKEIDCFSYLQWRSEGGRGGASAPGRRPEGERQNPAKDFFLNLYKEKF